jgi:hypothetical protein
MPDPSTPVAEAPEQAPVAAAEPAPSKTSPTDAPLSGFAEALRAGGRGALKERSSRSARQDAKAPPEASADDDSEESPEASKSDAVKPGESTPPGDAGTGLSRRGAAKALSEKEAEIADLRAKWEADQKAVKERDGRLQELTAKQKASRDFVLSKIGDDKEFDRLQTARMKREWMTAEDDDKLDEMLTWREHAAALWELTDTGHRALLARDLDAVVEQYGLDRKTAFGADAPALAAHVAERVEKRIRDAVADEIKTLKSKHKDEVSELEKELSSLRPLAAHRTPAPTVGGMSAPSGADLGERASPLARMAAAFRTGPPRRGGDTASRRAS